MMPRMDGVQLCRWVRAQLGAPYTYFILLTALGDSQHRMAGMQAGADDYLPKPFNVDDIEARLIAAERVTIVHRRREALLRLARQFAAETDPASLLNSLLREAVALVDGSTGFVARWHDDEQTLVPAVTDTGAPEVEYELGIGATARAARERVPILVRRDSDWGPEPAPAMLRQPLEAAIAVPLLHEARLLGTLTVGSDRTGMYFTREDADVLEVLASTAGAALVALERARLEGVLLAARTAQHELNNQLAVARGYAEMLVGSPELPAHLVEIAAEVMNAADDAASIVRRLRNISRIHEQYWSQPGDTTINLGRSQN
jgi:CheY-like chemotaxis protein